MWFPKKPHRAYTREINHLRRKTWEKVRKDGLEVGKAAPFSHLLPAFSQDNPPPSPAFPTSARFQSGSNRPGFPSWLHQLLVFLFALSLLSKHNTASRTR